MADLAEYASRLGPEDSLSLYESRYFRLRSTAEASSVKEAREMVEANILRLQKQASEL